MVQTNGMNSRPLNSNLHNASQDLNPFIFNDMPELDLFDMFDTNFDLDGIDAFLEGNLDLSFPTNLQ